MTPTLESAIPAARRSVMAAALLCLFLLPSGAGAQLVEPIEAPEVSFKSDYVKQVFHGRFAGAYTVLKEAQGRTTEETFEQALALNAGYSSAFMAYMAISNEVCGEQTIGAPVAMQRKWTEVIRNGLGIELSRTKHDTGVFIVSEQLADDVYGNGFAMGLNIAVLDFKQMFEPLLAVADMRLFFAQWPCRSAGLAQFQENLVRYTQRRPSLQDDYDQAMIPVRLETACRESLPGIAPAAAAEASCACLSQSFVAALDQQTLKDLTREYTRRQFLLTSISAVGLNDKVKECLQP